MLLTTKEIAEREAAMVQEITGNDVSKQFVLWGEDAENANKSVADYVPNVGYNVEYFDLDGIEKYIENMANEYIRTWWQLKTGVLIHDKKSGCIKKAV